MLVQANAEVNYQEISKFGSTKIVKKNKKSEKEVHNFANYLTCKIFSDVRFDDLTSCFPRTPPAFMHCIWQLALVSHRFDSLFGLSLVAVERKVWRNRET